MDVATTDDDGPGRRVELALGKRIEREGYDLFFFRKQTEFYKVSRPFSRWLTANLADYDLAHIHALFSFTSTSAARTARRLRIPYVVRPLGVLNRWGTSNRRPLLKSLSFQLVERSILHNAAAIHYTSHAEQKEAEEFGAPHGGMVIPLGLEGQSFYDSPGPDRFWERFPQAKDRPVILFLSRIHPKKGLDLLLPTFAAVKKKYPRTVLAVAGSGEAGYVESLKQKAANLGLATDVLWTGQLEGVAKLSAFAAATLYVLPSYSENFGIALVEALGAGVPSVTTTGVAVAEEIRVADAGIVVEPNATALSSALDRLLGDSQLREEFRGRSRRLVKERFSAEAMAQSLKALYERVLAKN